MTESRDFHLGDILSITTGFLVAPGHMAAVHELLDYMTGDTLFTHQLPRASRECEPALLAQHPDLASVEVPDEFRNEAHVKAWRAAQVVRFGKTRTVKPLASGDHTSIDPSTELAINYPNVKVIGVEVPGGAA